MNEAALLAARRRKSQIGKDEVEEAMERVLAGPERKSRVITEKERRTIAFHESGHALVGHVLDNSDPVHKISLVSRGRALGYTMQLPEEDRFLKTREEMFDEIAVLLGGRTAEELFCDDITTGASNDLERATKMAREMVTRYGMTEALGAQIFGEAQHEVFLGRDYANRQDYSAETAKRIDDEVERIMREAHERARSILEARRPSRASSRRHCSTTVGRSTSRSIPRRRVRPLRPLSPQRPPSPRFRARRSCSLRHAQPPRRGWPRNRFGR